MGCAVFGDYCHLVLVTIADASGLETRFRGCKKSGVGGCPQLFEFLRRQLTAVPETLGIDVRMMRVKLNGSGHIGGRARKTSASREFDLRDWTRFLAGVRRLARAGYACGGSQHQGC